MLSAEPWLNAAVVHEREQTYHGVELCNELWSTGAKAVSFLPSRPTANLISGVGQLPKSAAPEAVAGCATAVPLFAAVEDEEPWPVELEAPVAPDASSGTPWSDKACTDAKSVLIPKTLLKAGNKISRMKLTSKSTNYQPVCLS